MKMQPENNRLPEIDLIKGIALFGILLMNIDFFSTSNIASEWKEHFSNSTDLVIGKLKFFLIEQKFIGIFSFLFGLGVAMQKNHFEQLKISFFPYYFKRTALLAVFGSVNILFFFMGDILLVYSLFSIILIIFFKLSNRTLWISALLIFYIPVFFEVVSYLRELAGASGESINQYYTRGDIITTYQSGSLTEIIKLRVTEYLHYDISGVTWNRTSGALMILGFLTGKNNLHKTYLQYWKTIKILSLVFTSLLIIYLAVIFIAKINFSYSFPFQILYHTFILLTIAVYILIILFIYQKAILKPFTSLLISAGKMSLTNYFFQSIICAFLFTNYGFGLYFKTSPTQNLLICTGIFASQLIISHFYLKKFRTGPLEYFWRKISGGNAKA